jgi:FixJ family two-component response regulator
VGAALKNNEDFPARPVVFVVEADASSRETLSSLIRSVGLVVESFCSAQKFLTTKLPRSPCCLVLGVMLAEPGGLNFQAELARANIQIPIIFTTDDGDIPTSVRAMKAGAVDFLIKPFRAEDMLHSIQVALERDRVRQEGEKTLAGLRGKFETLTHREHEVMALVTAGLSNKQIAAEIGITVATIKFFRANVVRKMGAKSRANLVRMADLLNVRRTMS